MAAGDPLNPPNSFKHKDDDGYFTQPWQQFWLALKAAATALVNLATDVTGRLPYSHFTQASAASKLLGRGSAAGAGDWQEISLGSNLTMTGTTLAATASAPGGASGDLQYNNAGAFGGSVLKQPAVDLIEQKDGTTTQEARLYNTVSGGDFERLATKWEAAGFFSEPCFTLYAEKGGAGAVNGVQLKSQGGEAVLWSEGFTAVVCYHDVTSAGGINFIVDVPSFIGHIFCNQGGSYMETPGGFSVNHMIALNPDQTKALIIGRDPSGADFDFRFLTFDSSNGGAKTLSVGNITGKGTASSGIPFVLDEVFNGVVANLPAAPPTSSMLWVVDALAPVIGSAVVGGGGAFAAVMWNGAQWTVFSV